jgi:hypothetical protein
VTCAQELLPEKSLLPFVQRPDGTYNGCHFWSNFEVVDLGFFRSAQYSAYFGALDASGGFFLERWGDAPVHTLAAALFLNSSQVSCTWAALSHQQHISLECHAKSGRTPVKQFLAMCRCTSSTIMATAIIP